jgi:hypothetical protein
MRPYGQIQGLSQARRLPGLRSAERAAGGLDEWVTGNCSARDFADFVRFHAISRVYLALPISTAAHR